MECKRTDDDRQTVRGKIAPDRKRMDPSTIGDCGAFRKSRSRCCIQPEWCTRLLRLIYKLFTESINLGLSLIGKLTYSYDIVTRFFCTSRAAVSFFPTHSPIQVSRTNSFSFKRWNTKPIVLAPCYRLKIGHTTKKRIFSLPIFTSSVAILSISGALGYNRNVSLMQQSIYL